MEDEYGQILDRSIACRGVTVKIDITEQFEHLARAPIVEAVIQVHARPGVPWEEADIVARLKPNLAEFQEFASQSNVRHQVTIGAAQPAKVLEKNLGWHGLSCKTKAQSVQFNRDGFIFSQLQPYPNWDQFFGDAMRLWKIYLNEAQPKEMQRIGLRFINRIQLPPKETNFEKYIQPYPEPPFNLELPFSNFFHSVRLVVPGYPYGINIIRTIHQSQDPKSDGIGLIVDIDAFTNQPFEVKDGVLEERLAELRWLKNRTFFGSITSDSLKLFK